MGRRGFGKPLNRKGDKKGGEIFIFILGEDEDDKRRGLIKGRMRARAIKI